MHKNVDLKIKKIFYKFLVAIFGITAPDYPLDDILSKFHLIFKILQNFLGKFFSKNKNSTKFAQTAWVGVIGGGSSENRNEKFIKNLFDFQFHIFMHFSKN